MCLIIFGLNIHPRYRLILAANRDEFYARPTKTAQFWEENPQVLAGQDLTAGGTWLGITKTGRFAAVTNYRDLSAPSGMKSRGDLTKEFLTGGDSPENYLRRIESEKSDYSGFNLLVGEFAEDKDELFYFSNRGENSEKLTSGIYGLSNALLGANWRKIEAGKSGFEKILQTADEIQSAPLFEILADRRRALDEELPQTGVGIERERILSPAFIETSGYGTRISTVLTIERGGRVKFIEKTFVGTVGEIKQEFALETS
jgi:uncharacterized protein with NRDE domain